MICGLTRQFQSHFLVNNYLPANLRDGFFDQYRSFLQLSFVTVHLLFDP